MVPARLGPRYHSRMRSFGQKAFFLWVRCLYRLNLAGWGVVGTVAMAYRLLTRRHQRVVAITGSVGKTSTTRAIMTVLRGAAPDWIHAGDNCFSLVGINLLRQLSARWAAVEVGIGEPGQMWRYAATLRPDAVVMTAIASDHLAWFPSREALWQEKARMIRALGPEGLAILNGDDGEVMRMASLTRARVITFGLSPGCDYCAEAVALHPSGTRFTLCAEGTRTVVQSQLVGRDALRALLAAAAVGRAAGMAFDAIGARLEEVPAAPARMQPLRLPCGAVALRDDFKAGIETVHAALDTLASLEASRRIVVLGSLYRPVAPRGEAYAAVGRHAAVTADRIVLFGRKASLYRRGMPAAAAAPVVDHVRNIDEAVSLLRGILGPGDVVLLKGRGEEKLGRIALELCDRPVACRIPFCPLENILCQDCPYGRDGVDGRPAAAIPAR